MPSRAELFNRKFSVPSRLKHAQLFAIAEAKPIAAEACALINQWMMAEKDSYFLEGIVDQVHLEAGVLEAVEYYIMDRNYENARLTYAYRTKAQRLNTKTKALIQELCAFSKEGQAQLAEPLRRRLENAQESKDMGDELSRIINRSNATMRSVSSVNHIDDLMQRLQTLIAACQSLAAADVSRTSNDAVDKLCRRLVELREVIKDDDFAHSWDAGSIPKSRNHFLGEGKFASVDPLFVQVCCRAIDPELTFAKIRTRLRAVVATRGDKTKP